MGEIIWLTKRPTIGVSITQNPNKRGIALYDETHI